MMLVTPDAPLWIISRVMISARCEELIQSWGKARKTFAPEDIHDLRVASRRLREAINIFERCYPAKNLSHINTQAKQLTNFLGAIRNTDEALLFFTPQLLSLPENISHPYNAWLQALRNRRTKEHKNLENRLKKLNLALMQYGLRKALEKPCLFGASAHDPFMPISKFFKDKLLEREKLLLQLLPDALLEKNFNALHSLRIALKKFRYAFELTAPLISEGYREFYAILKEFQELLGKIHDLDVFFELIKKQEFGHECFVIQAELITSRRKSLHADFLNLHANHPLDRLGALARELL